MVSLYGDMSGFRRVSAEPLIQRPFICKRGLVPDESPLYSGNLDNKKTPRDSSVIFDASPRWIYNGRCVKRRVPAEAGGQQSFNCRRETRRRKGQQPRTPPGSRRVPAEPEGQRSLKCMRETRRRMGQQGRTHRFPTSLRWIQEISLTGTAAGLVGDDGSELTR